MKRTATEVIRHLEMRVARLERQANSGFEYKTITNEGRKLLFSFLTEDGDIKNVSWKAWSESNLPDRTPDQFRKDMQTTLIQKAQKNIQFNVLIDLNKHRGNFVDTLNWLHDHGIRVSARGIKVY